MGSVTLTDPVAGTTIAAGLHATNNAQLRAALNNGLDTANWASGLIFPPSKLQQEAAGRQDGMIWNGTIWVPKAVASVYDRATTTVDVQNSTTETSIYTKSIAGNDMGTNKMLRLEIFGDFLHNNVAGDTLTFRVKFGGTTLFADAADFGAATGATREDWGLAIRLANLGVTNSQMLKGALQWTVLTGAATTGIGDMATGKGALNGLGISTLAAIDTTVAQTLDVTVQWSAASVNNSWRMRYSALELV